MIEEGMDFYRSVSDLIDQGMTLCQEVNTKSYAKPTGEQLVIRKFGNRYLAVFHRFENSKALDESFLMNANILGRYGIADGDFTATAIHYEINR